MTEQVVLRSVAVGDVRVDDGRNVTLRLLTYGRDYSVSDDGQRFYTERWSEGAFRRSFGHHGAQHNDSRFRLPLAYEHERPGAARSMPVGVATRAWEEGPSVMIGGRISPTSTGDDLLVLLRDEVVRGVSIEAVVFKQRPFVGGIERSEAALRRVVFTTLPQYDDAELVAMRSEIDPPATPTTPRLDAVRERLDALGVLAIN